MRTCSATHSRLERRQLMVSRVLLWAFEWRSRLFCSLLGRKACGRCMGTGQPELNPDYICSRCDGRGWVPVR